MPDSPWLFPGLAGKLVCEHNRYFSSMAPPGRALTSTEIPPLLRAIFPAGWRFEIETPQKNIPAALFLMRNAPFSAPRIALLDDQYYLKWPHVEEHGLLCLRDTETICHSTGVELATYYIRKAKELIDNNLNLRNTNDFISEFQSYWSRWRTLKSKQSGRVLLLLKPGPPTRDIHLADVNGYVLACDTITQGMKWIEERYPAKKVSADKFFKGAFVWLKNGLIPEIYPKTNAGFARIVREEDNITREQLMAVVPKDTGTLHVVFGFESGNGPALGAVCLNEPAKSPRPGKKIYPRFNGFRRKGSPRKVTTERYFSTDGRADPMPVQRIDRSWIFERGSTGANEELENIRVGVIGCGSLGAQIAMLLAQSGIRRFLLIDPDCLSFDNIARHLLGGSCVDQPKVDAMEKYLKSHFPGMMEISPQNKSWETVFKDKNDNGLLLSCDLIVSTIGSWDSESALNHCFNGQAEFPAIVYGWTEPYGLAGHALLVTGIGGCLACGMNEFGKFVHRITDWPSDGVKKRAPACGDTYQPYGVLDIAQTRAMIARLCMELVTGRVNQSQHWAWFGDIEGISETDGKLMEGLSDYYGEIGQGNRVIKRPWLFSTECRYGH